MTEDGSETSKSEELELKQERETERKTVNKRVN
jgi:hypothetical protein